MGAIRVELRDGGYAEIEVEAIVSMTKRTDLGAGDPPTQVNLDEGSLVTVDSIRTIVARAGDDAGLRELAGADAEWPVAVALGKVTHLTKRDEERSLDDDPTQVHMANGDTLLSADSIRTIQAIMGLHGLPMEEIDVIGTERPAAAVPGHVLSAFETDVDDGRNSVLVMAGGKSLVVRDIPATLTGSPQGPKA